MKAYHPILTFADSDENAILNAPVELTFENLSVREVELCIEHIKRNIQFELENLHTQEACDSLINDVLDLQTYLNYHAQITRNAKGVKWNTSVVLFSGTSIYAMYTDTNTIPLWHLA